MEIPEFWTNKRVKLHLERPHWESKVFINDLEAGSNNSLSVPHEYDITSLVRTGKNRISIRIDNREIIPVGVNSHSISDHTQSNWNGIVGDIYMESYDPVNISDIQIYPEIGTNNARLVITIHNQTGAPFEGSIKPYINYLFSLFFRNYSGSHI